MRGRQNRVTEPSSFISVCPFLVDEYLFISGILTQFFSSSATLLLYIFSPKALLLHLKRFVYEEKPVDEKENQPDNAPQAMEITFRKNKVRVSSSCEIMFCSNTPPHRSYYTVIIVQFQSPVVLSESVSLDKFMKGNAGGVCPDNKYSIKSLVYHIGARASSGHYTADATRERPADSGEDSGKEEWVSFDDSIAATKSHDDVLESIRSKRTAYMILYELD